MKRILTYFQNLYKTTKTIPAAVKNLKVLQTTKRRINNIKNVYFSPNRTRTGSKKISYISNKSIKVQKKKLPSEAINIVIGMSTITCLMASIIYILGKPDIDNGEDDLSEKSRIIQYLLRAGNELRYYKTILKAPANEKLLPDPLEYPYLQPKYTLVLELTDVLVHPEWTYTTGWRYKRRPLLDYFLETLRGKYEIVIYTAEQGVVVFPLVASLDPKNIIAHKLVRDATYFTAGLNVKALDKLNRDLSKVICVDWNAKNVKFNPENLLNVKRWTGSDNDTSLLDLASFLVTIVASEVDDVREVLKYYSQFDDPVEAYRGKQQRLIEQLEEEAAADKSNQ